MEFLLLLESYWMNWWWIDVRCHRSLLKSEWCWKIAPASFVIGMHIWQLWVSYFQKVPKGQDRCSQVLLVGECRGGNVWGLGIGAFKTVWVEKWKRLAFLYTIDTSLASKLSKVIHAKQKSIHCICCQQNVELKNSKWCQANLKYRCHFQPQFFFTRSNSLRLGWSIVEDLSGMRFIP